MTNSNHKHLLLLNEREKKRSLQVASIAFRRNLLESQKRMNYVFEFDRLRNEIESRKIRGLRNLPVLENRIKKLKELSIESLSGLTPEIFE